MSKSYTHLSNVVIVETVLKDVETLCVVVSSFPDPGRWSRGCVLLHG